MKGVFSFGIAAVLLIALILILAMVNFNLPLESTHMTGAASIVRQVSPTATPISGGESEIGSTSGILVMGVVIVLIVTLPLLFRKKS